VSALSLSLSSRSPCALNHLTPPLGGRVNPVRVIANQDARLHLERYDSAALALELVPRLVGTHLEQVIAHGYQLEPISTAILRRPPVRG
jgi:hypothetical protein